VQNAPWKVSCPATHHGGVWGGGRYSSNSLTSALDGVSGQRHGERTPGTHWIGGWVGPRAGLDVGART
jgi:hypothetical protein